MSLRDQDTSSWAEHTGQSIRYRGSALRPGPELLAGGLHGRLEIFDPGAQARARQAPMVADIGCIHPRAGTARTY